VVLDQRPTDVAVRIDGRVLIKTNGQVALLDTAAGAVASRLDVPNGTSLTGLAVLSDGRSFAVSDARSTVHFGTVTATGTLAWLRSTAFPNAGVGGAAYPCGIASLKDGAVLVALSRSNQLAWVNATGAITRTIDVDIAPTAIGLSPDRQTAYVACWSRRPNAGETTATSSGSAVPVNLGGAGHQATLLTVNVATGEIRQRTRIEAQPLAVATHRDGRVFVAASSMGRINVIDGKTGLGIRSVAVTPVSGGDYRGSAPNGLSLNLAQDRLYVSCGGTNHVAVLNVGGGSERLQGAIPAAWYPAGIAVNQGRVIIANAKGYGSRRRPGENPGRSVYDFTGIVQVVTEPVVRPILMTGFVAPRLAKRRPNQAPVPVPERLGERSAFDHVVLIIKENRTYDQVFGDMTQGNSDPRFCNYGRAVTPNHHAMAEEFMLLDNFYCNGVLSADGHAWVTEGNATSFYERSFGGWTRSYPFGDDPLAVSGTGYLWDRFLETGQTIRNFGEFDYATPQPAGATFKEIYDDFTQGQNRITFAQNIGVARIRAHSNTASPGWNMRIPDVLRAGRFITDLKRMETEGKFPNLTLIYLPQDHTSGTTPGEPTPRACVADNDLALGRVVEAISSSMFWPKTCIFVMEDDPQSGVDHVDGHRTVGLVISPYSRRRGTVSDFYDQTSMRATMLRMRGLAPQSIFDATAPLMTTCFGTTPDLTPYKAKVNQVPLDELNPPRAALSGQALILADQSARLNLSGPDRADEDILNRILWFSARGTERFPAEWAGPHGKGLPAGFKIRPLGD